MTLLRNANLALLKAFAYWALISGGLAMLTGCSNTFSWEEEVKLLDGRVIKVQQKRRFDEWRMPREAWLRFKLSEFGNQEIVWHENLHTMVLNVHQGKLYVVGKPVTEIEYKQYGRPEPFYIGFRYEGDRWVRIPFEEIPEAIYDANMWFENMIIYKLKYVSLDQKDTLLLRDKGYLPDQQRIDPKYVSNFGR